MGNFCKNDIKIENQPNEPRKNIANKVFNYGDNDLIEGKLKQFE